jgi:LysM repeat protein
LGRSLLFFGAGRIEVKKLKRRWIGSVALGLAIIALCAHPSTARLSEGKFLPFSQAIKEIADQQLQLYRIEKGDTLCKIARKNNVKLEELLTVNNLQENTILEIGRTIKIPANPSTTYVVAPGDTLSKVAELCEVSLGELVDANQDQDPNSLEVGDCLRIPSRGDAGKVINNTAVEPSRGRIIAGTLSWPVNGEISSSYGIRKNGFHHGIDIVAKKGTPIHAAAAGIVSFVGWKSVYGRTIVIDHSDGKQTLYAHTQSYLVKKGDKVDRGEEIATVGLTGVTTGPHVHFEVRYGNKCYNPLEYLRR